jgi:hypothetical protein
MTEQLTDAHAPQVTLDSLRVLIAHRGASVDAIHPAVATQATDAGIASVWIVTADTFEIGNTDLDNETVTVGAYGSLPVAVADVWRKVITGERIHNPHFAQHIIQTVLHPAVPTVTPTVTQDGCDYDGDAGSQLGAEDCGPW